MHLSKNYEPKLAGDIKKLNKGDWGIASKKCHISKSDVVDSLSKELGFPSPEMIFAENYLKIHHVAGLKLEFNALAALKLVSTSGTDVKVEYANKWQKYRSDKDDSIGVGYEVMNNYDWTYTTLYQGSWASEDEEGSEQTLKIDLDIKGETLDLEKLKERERLLFFDDVILYEDELGDNGCCKVNVRVRAMHSGFFVLLRMFLRVDGVLIKIHDTRMHHLYEKDYILREFQARERPMTELQEIIKNNQALTEENTYHHLNLTNSRVDKIYLYK